MSKGGPIFGRPGNWRNVISDKKGAKYLSLDFIQLEVEQSFKHQPQHTESIYVIIEGSAYVKSKEKEWELTFKDVIFLNANETFELTATVSNDKNQLTKIVYCRSLPFED